MKKERKRSPFQDAPVEPIMLRRLQLKCSSWSIQAFRVNRHLQPFDRVAPHTHPHGQLLLYLRGRGEQEVGKRRWAVGVGAVFFIPAGKKHAFRETGPRRAICLVADLGGEGPRRWGFRHGVLPADGVAEIRQRVSAMGAERSGSLELSAGSAALLVLDLCRDACSTRVSRFGGVPAILRRLESVWRLDGEGKWPRPADLAKKVGLQKDYLNRLVRRASGLTLGQWRARQLLKRVEKELVEGARIGQVALRSGFSDSNYFSRWFKKQTGLAPKKYFK